jgi:hypothetical protein
MMGWMKLLKDVGMLNEASPESIRSSMWMDTLEAPTLLAAHHPSIESLTLQLSTRVGVVGGWRGGFFFSSCIWCGGWTVHVHLDSGLSMQVLFGHGGGFFFHFSLFPNVFSRCSL